MKSYLSCEGFGCGLCVCGGDRSGVTEWSFVASPQGHWPVKKKCPRNHETMRVITYLGESGGPLMDVLDLKPASFTRNIKEPRFKIGELWTTLCSPKKRQPYQCGAPKMDKHGAVLSAKIEGAVKKEKEKTARMNKWPVCSIPLLLKTVVNLMGWPHIFFWLMLLFFSLCPEFASSQVLACLRKWSMIPHCGLANACTVSFVSNLKCFMVRLI